ncbi:DUF2452 domain-containing protein [bacterium]|nr:DUF2452 domain-containing protein [candidate division CSSED10-310 bacterium]
MTILELEQSDEWGWEMPEGKSNHPTHPNQAPFKAMQRYLDVERLPDSLDVVREVRNQAVKKLEMLDQMHRELIGKARSIIEKAKEDLRLHSVRMHAAKIRNRIYYLYSRDKGNEQEFFSILDPDEYHAADPNSRYIGAYRLNEDSSWTRLE